MREGVATVQAVEKAAGVEARNRRILVIDDNPAIHEDFRKIFCGDMPTTECQPACNSDQRSASRPDSSRYSALIDWLDWSASAHQ
jgi:hypothetical protein